MNKKIKKIIQKTRKEFKKLKQKNKTKYPENQINFFEWKKINEFTQILKENNCTLNSKQIIKWYLGTGFAFGLISIGFSSLQELNFFYSFLLFCFCFIIPGITHYFYHLFLFEKNKKEKEEIIPDVLLQASIFPKGTPIIKIIEYISKSDYGLISKEFRKAFNEIQKGKTIEKALQGISERSKSRIISRALNLLIQGNKSGAEMNKVFKESAEDILETQSIIKERIASLFIQKYTLILAGGIIVPMLLGLIVGFVQEMNFIGIEELGLGMNEIQRNELISASMLANQIYIIEYALISSLFIANQEGQIKKFLVYSLILIPIGILSYNFALIL